MKILKVKIKRNQGGGKTSYVYPPEYDAQKINILTYESQMTEGYNKVVNRGNKDEIVIGTVEDIHAQSFLISPDIVELTRAEVNIFLGEDLDKTTVKVIDEGATLQVLAKNARGETLTTEDLEVLDNDNPRKGLGRSRSLNEVLVERGL